MINLMPIITLLIFIHLSYIVFCYLRSFYSLYKIRNSAFPAIHTKLPYDTTPGAYSFFVNGEYDHNALAADLLDMAIKGWITIQVEPGILLNNFYLIKKERKNDNSLYTQIFDTLFASTDKVGLWQRTAFKKVPLTLWAVEYKAKNYYWPLSNYFNDAQKRFFFQIIMITIVLMVIEFFNIVAIDYRTIYMYYGFALMGERFINSWIIQYTKQGYEVVNNINGFKSFLAGKTVSKQKKDLNLYESYLPYACVLNVHTQWTKQFENLFKNSSRIYQPSWMIAANSSWWNNQEFNSVVAKTFKRKFFAKVFRSIYKVNQTYKPAQKDSGADIISTKTTFDIVYK